MARKLHYIKENALYLLLNIIGHDVIHDYGPAGCSDPRWQKNQSFAKQFYSDYLSFTNPMKGGELDGKRMRLNDSGSSSTMTTSEESPDAMQIAPLSSNSNVYGFVPGRKIVKVKRPDNRGLGMGAPTFPGIGRTTVNIIEQNYDEYLTSIKDNKSIISTTFVFTFFNHFLTYYVNTDINPSLSMNFQLSNYFLIPLASSYQEVFVDLCNKFIGYCYTNNISNNLNFEEYYNILCTFLSSYAVEQVIFENIDLNPFQSIGVKRSLVGGVKPPNKKLTPEGAVTLVSQLETLYASADMKTNFAKLSTMLQRKETLTTDEKKNYTAIRGDLINQFKQILTSNGQMAKAYSMDVDFICIPPIDIRVNRSRDADLSIVFKEKLDAMLKDVNKIIDDDKDKKEAIAQKQLKQSEAAEKQRLKEEEAAEKQRLKDLEAELSGDLTSKDRDVRENFSAFIAKASLYLTGLCSETGIVNSTLNTIPQNSALRKQMNILLYIADWRQNPEWRDIKTQDLDTTLINYFNETYDKFAIYDSGNNRFMCRASNNYVVNNAANIQGLSVKSFCPYSSILDGMSLCSWNTAQGNVESGNMNFYISNNEETMYYNGIMSVLPNKLNINLSFNVKLTSTNLTGNKSITINGSDLEAHTVLKNTLVNIINYILKMSTIEKKQMFIGGNVFENLFNSFVKTNVQLFNVVFSEILFKGTGDLFQEINCVSKFGGYVMDSSYMADKTIDSYANTKGDQLRFFAANDRPSGTRFIFMLLNGSSNEINNRAVGGYYSENKLLIVKLKNNLTICKDTKGGRKPTNKKTKKRRHTKKRFTRKNNFRKYKK